MATIEIDGKTVEVEPGKMIIEVADEAGITIPRFCYHKKLSVAANCRMCLVQVEKVNKALPACATPVTDGMKVFTKSPMARAAQKAVMEFLLINHPLDCPICDQGGECELQDVSLGFGQGSSDYSEQKRVVADDNLGTLIATDMTRCIHCTRCVRFGEEVAGIRELGATGRGEHTQIGTFVEKNMVSEISGNVIDLCPVGALTSKPYRFNARAWELKAYPSISPHDCMGSNLEIHVRRGDVMRVVPRENEAVNETWLSDRDRFSYMGLSGNTRIAKPRIKRNGQWQEVDWQTALNFAVEGLLKVKNTHGEELIAGLCNPSSTLEEAYLMQKVLRGFGVNSLDHRLKQIDFKDDGQLHAPVSSLSFEDLEKSSNVLIIGSDLREELPLAAVRVRKAVAQGAKVAAINPVDFELNFNLSEKAIVPISQMAMRFLSFVKVVLAGKGLQPKHQAFLDSVPDDESAKVLFKGLGNGEEAVTIISGLISSQHPDSSRIRSGLKLLELYQSNIQVLGLTEGANSAGCFLTGMLPNQGPFGESVESGVNVQQALEAKMRGYVLLGVEAEFDFADPQLIREALLSADFVVSMNAFVSSATLDCSDVILPIATFSETSGTYVNANGLWQSFKGCIAPLGEARPAWKVLRVLGNLLGVEDVDHNSSDDVLTELKNIQLCSGQSKVGLYVPDELNQNESSEKKAGFLERIGPWPMYRQDALSRSSGPLQESGAAQKAVARVHPETLKHVNVSKTVTVSQGDIEVTLPLELDSRIARDSIYIPSGLLETVDLNSPYDQIFVK